MSNAFISHASQDREVAERICTFLEERGIHCWIAPRDVRPGRRYGEEIVGGIESADAVVLVLSENANTSTFVEREIERAVSYGKPTLPVRVREVQPSRSLELFISNAHWIDAWKPPMEQYLDRLADSIRSLSPEGGEATKEKRKTIHIGWRGKRLAKRIAIIAGVLLLLGAGATATWWFLGRQRSTIGAPPTVSSTPSVPVASTTVEPTVAEVKPAATPLLAEKTPPLPATQTTLSPIPERKQETPESVVSESPANTPGTSVSDVLAAIGNTSGRARDQAIEQNIQRLPPQITIDELLAITKDTLDRDSAIKMLGNRLPNPIKVDDALRILGNAASRQRTFLIEILLSRLPPTIMVKDLLALIEQTYGRSDVIRQLVSRLPNPLSIEETLQILSNTASRERFGLIQMLGLRMPQKIAVKDLLAIIENSYDRNGAIQELVNRLPNPLSLEELMQILNNTASRERSALIEMLNSRIPEKLSPKDMLGVIEGAYDRNGRIRLLLGRLPTPISFDDFQLILGSTSSRERFGLIDILHSRAPHGLSSAQISSLVQGSYDPTDAEKLLRK